MRYGVVGGCIRNESKASFWNLKLVKIFQERTPNVVPQTEINTGKYKPLSAQ